MPNKSSPHGGFICAGTVSHGTLRTQDLLRTFADEYARILPFNSSNLVSEARDNANILDMRKPDGSDVATDKDHDIAQAVLQDLQDALQECAAREGLYFGTHEGDGSDFGYWETEDEG